MKLYLSVDALNVVRWWVYAFFSTHWGCRSHTVDVMYIGKSYILSLSIKQKMNTASSTEAELVGIADALGLIMWVKYFMEAQVYTIDSNIMFLD